MVHKTDCIYRMAIYYCQLNAVSLPCGVLLQHRGGHVQILWDNILLWIGLMQCKHLTADCCLLLGLVTAWASYNLLMRIVLYSFPNLSFYFHNVFVYSSDCFQHCSTLRAVFYWIRTHGLTFKSSKCRYGFPTIQYLGFILGRDQLQPQPNKVEALCCIPPPQTKKTLRGFLSMISFYKGFIPQAANFTAPLSDLKKTVQESLPWTEELEMCLNHFKFVLSSSPVLRLQDARLPFVRPSAVK